MEVIAGLLLLLVLTRALGSIAARLHLPAAAGEITAGIALAALLGLGLASAPFVGPLFGGIAASPWLEHVADAGIFFLVLLAGVEMKPAEIAQRSGRTLAVACGGVAVPLAAGAALAWLVLPESPAKLVLVLLVGVALSISAIPESVKILTEFSLLHTAVGETVVAAAVIDDVLGLFLLAVLTSVIATGGVPDTASLALMLGKAALFFAITVTLGVHVYPHVSRRIRALQVATLEFSTLMAVALAYGLLAELLGMHWIIGAFMAGLYFEPSRVGALAYNEMKLLVTGITGGFLGPLFFASIGLRVELDAVIAVPVFVASLIGVAFIGKVVGAGLPARWAGLSGRDALCVGVGMNARGAVELVVISIAYEAGLFARADQGDPIVAHLFSALVLMAVLTTLMTPVLLRLILGRDAGRQP